jgi:hypothetical protein
MPRASDFVTILYQPRETMRRVLSLRDRWTWQIVALAAICGSIDDPDFRRLRASMPTLSMASIILLGIGSVIAIAIGWIVVLFLLAWLAAFAGRVLGGAAPVRDVRAALAWSMVPMVWTIVYRIPAAIYRHQLLGDPNTSAREALANFLANGGCSLLLIVLLIKVVTCIWVLWIASAAIAEAQQFPTSKGAANVAITIVAPIAIVAAAVIAFHNQ